MGTRDADGRRRYHRAQSGGTDVGGRQVESVPSNDRCRYEVRSVYNERRRGRVLKQRGRNRRRARNRRDRVRRLADGGRRNQTRCGDTNDVRSQPLEPQPITVLDEHLRSSVVTDGRGYRLDAIGASRLIEFAVLGRMLGSGINRKISSGLLDGFLARLDVALARGRGPDVLIG